MNKRTKPFQRLQRVEILTWLACRCYVAILSSHSVFAGKFQMVSHHKMEEFYKTN